MQRQDFTYSLPEELIARHPLAERSASRLLYLPASGPFVHHTFRVLPDLLRSGDVLVLNDTAVIKARLRGTKDSGGAAEVLVERITGEREALCQVRVSKPLKTGRRIRLDGGRELTVLGREGEFYRLSFGGAVLEVLDACGEIPLPPYLERGVEAADEQRYQTVFAENPGAVAAPTAGLHFDQGLLAQVAAGGVQIARVTLHVGAGTFQPVRVDDISAHRMHAEWYSVLPEAAAVINAARQAGGRVIAVGTTVVRTLESVTDAEGTVQPGQGETRLFITPGYRFRAVDAFVTNFHLPETTLLMLVCAFGGTERVLAAYAGAVASGYRFFSYGDAMYLEKPARHQVAGAVEVSGANPHV